MNVKKSIAEKTSWLRERKRALVVKKLTHKEKLKIIKMIFGLSENRNWRKLIMKKWRITQRILRGLY